MAMGEAVPFRRYPWVRPPPSLPPGEHRAGWGWASPPVATLGELRPSLPWWTLARMGDVGEPAPSLLPG